MGIKLADFQHCIFRATFSAVKNNFLRYSIIAASLLHHDHPSGTAADDQSRECRRPRTSRRV